MTLTTQSRRTLGKNPNRRNTKGAFGGANSPTRQQDMMERYNEAFTKKLEKMRAKNEREIK